MRKEVYEPMSTEKRIEVVTMKAKDIKTGFGNPRKITKKKYDELKASLENDGDYGIFLIDEQDNVISGNQRLSVIMKLNPETELLCKRLIGYSEVELRSINIRSNTHAGEWDLDLLADWTADLNVDLGIELNNTDLGDRKLKDMELIRYEKYDYVLLVCRNELDYNELIRKFGIDGAKVKIPGTKRSIKARAIWYDQIKCQIKESE